MIALSGRTASKGTVGSAPAVGLTVGREALVVFEDRDDAQLLRLDELVTRCEAVFGGSQDIEFAFECGNLHLLQRRAITRE